MSQVSTSDGPHGSGPPPGHSETAPRSDAAPELRSESWRVIAVDGSTKAAPGQLDEATVARILANKPRHVPRLQGSANSDRDDEVEPLVDFLNDEDVTLLDLDLLSCDLSLLSVDVVPADKTPPHKTAVDPTVELTVRQSVEEIDKLPLSVAPASAAGDQQLSAVIRAWPRLPADLRDAIWWIARGGLRRSRPVR
jgi:hypothetical protein